MTQAYSSIEWSKITVTSVEQILSLTKWCIKRVENVRDVGRGFYPEYQRSPRDRFRRESAVHSLRAPRLTARAIYWWCVWARASISRRSASVCRIRFRGIFHPVPPSPCYTHVSRSREARRVSAIRGTHLQMPYLHHLRRDDPLGIQRTNCYARDDYVAGMNERSVYESLQRTSHAFKTFKDAFTKTFSKSRYTYGTCAKFVIIKTSAVWIIIIITLVKCKTNKIEQ